MSFFGELRRRNVVKVAVAYAIVGWLLVQIADTFFPALQLPEWTVTLVASLVILGFPLALILSWAYELTPEGVKKSHEVESTESINHATGRKIDFAIIGGLLAAVGFLLINYVFIDDDQEAIVQETVSPASEAEIPALAVVEEQRESLPNSVAVLLCDNLSPNPDDAFFAASIHEEILNQLMKIRSLTPIARTSVLQYADDPPPISQIAEELRVESVLECSVRYAGDAVMVTAQLIDPETNLHLWSDSYPGDRSDISAMFEMQADISMNIANALQAEFSVAEQASLARQLTDSPAAYELYMRALRSSQAQAGRETARLLFMQAIDLDPEFAAAYGRIALSTAASLVQSFGNPAVEPGERVRLESEVRRAVDQALRLDPNPVFASASALIDMYYWNWAEADQAFERALETSPNNTSVLLTLARLRSFQGMHEDAIEFMQRIVQLNPNGGTAHYTLASVLAHSGDSEAALAPAREAVNLSAGNPVTHLWLARIGSALDLDDEVAEHLSIAERLLINSPTPVGLASLAFTYSLIGYEEDVSRILEQLDAATPDRDFDAGSWVLGYLAQGDEDAAYEALQTVIERVERNEPDAAYWNLMIIKSNAQRHPVLDTPRFEELRSRIGTNN